MGMYESSAEFQLDRDFSKAAEAVKSAHQKCKLLCRESDKKDATIQTLTRRVEQLEMQERQYMEFRRLNEKEYRDLVLENEDLKRDLYSDQTEIDRLKDEITSLRKTMSTFEERVAFVTAEKEKADHIIKQLLNKIHQVANNNVIQPK